MVSRQMDAHSLVGGGGHRRPRGGERCIAEIELGPTGYRDNQPMEPGNNVGDWAPAYERTD